LFLIGRGCSVGDQPLSAVEWVGACAIVSARTGDESG